MVELASDDETRQDPATGSDAVVLTVPAQNRQLPVVRLLTEAVAMRNDCTLDQAADLKLAVDQICTLLIAAAAPATELTCRYIADAETFEAAITATTVADWQPERGSMEWRILQALTESVSVTQNPADSERTQQTAVAVRMRKPV